jgi:type II secretory pathway pseudopilin PulG
MKSNDDGYSLIETLIAFSVMALVLSVLLPGQAQLLGRAVNADERVLAMDYAASMLDQLGVSREIKQGGDAFEYRDWNVQYSTTYATELSPPNRYLRLTINIQNNQSVTLATITKVVHRDE